MLGQSSYRRGKNAEEYAAFWLDQEGYALLQRNFRGGGGEIDLIAEKNKVLYFVEVKARKAGLAQSAESISYQKKARLRRAALSWLSQHYPAEPASQFMVILLKLDDAGTVVDRHMFLSEL